MNVKIGKTLYDVYAMDFESHNDDDLIRTFESCPEKAETSIWLGYLCNEESTYLDSAFITMDDLMNRLYKISNPNTNSKRAKGKRSKHVLIYDYNLAFEWSFMLPWLVKNGWTFKKTFDVNDEKVFNTISTKSCSSVWSIKLKFHKGNSSIDIRDLRKILASGTLRKLAQSYKLETQKGDIEYTKNRRYFYYDDYPIEYNPYIPSIEEMIYCYKDVMIIIEILQKILEADDKIFWSSTSAASYSARTMITKSYEGAKQPYKIYRLDYPELDEDETKFLRPSVAGGICYASTLYQYKDINKPMIHIDAHQMHPTQMYTKKFPCGKGTYINLRDRTPIIRDGHLFNNRISCIHCLVWYDSVKIHSVIRCIGLERIPSYSPIELTLWDFEIPTMEKCYNNLHIEYLDCYVYKARYLKWKELVADNYRKRLVAKKEKDGYGIGYYKLLNNSFYGKLLEWPHNEYYINIIDDDGLIDSLVLPNDDIKINSRYTYLPVGSCIPAYSRVQLCETALLFGWKNVVYFDTDSIFAIIDDNTEDVLKKLDFTDFLGGWGVEGYLSRGQFTAPKRYKMIEDNEFKIKAAGISQKSFMVKDDNDKERPMTYDEVDIIHADYKSQRSYKIRGGMIIAPQIKVLNIQPKYQVIFNENWRDMFHEHEEIRSDTLE